MNAISIYIIGDTIKGLLLHTWIDTLIKITQLHLLGIDALLHEPAMTSWQLHFRQPTE